MHGKDEPKGRIGRILDKIFEYTFRLYYVKGKDLILADYFSRVPADCRKVDEVIPISFVNLCRCDDLTMFGMTTRRRARAAGVTVPKVHGVDKAVDPHVKPEHQKPHPCQVDKQYQPPVPDIASKPRFPQPCIQSRDQRVSRKLIERSRAVLNRRELSSNIPRDPQPVNDPSLPVPVPPARLQEPPNTPVHVPPFLCPAPAMQKPKAMNEVDAEYDPLMDTDSPYDDALVEIEYHRLVGDDFTIPPSLETQVEQGKLTKCDLPCQAEIDRIM